MIGYWLTYSGRLLWLDRMMHNEVSAFGIFASSFLLIFVHGLEVLRVSLPVMAILGAIGFSMHWWSIPARTHDYRRRRIRLGKH